MALKRVNVTMQEELYEEFKKLKKEGKLKDLIDTE